MSFRRVMAVGVGASFVGAHLVLAFAFLPTCEGPKFEMQIAAPVAAERLTIEAEAANAIARRTVSTLDGAVTALSEASAGPGVHRMEWGLEYRGGHRQAVGITQLVGPFQKPGEAPCSMRLFVGQSLLDDGKASPGTLAHIGRRLLKRELRGFSKWPIGDFSRVASLGIRWHADGLRLRTRVNFSRGHVRLATTIIPVLDAGKLRLRTKTTAKVTLDNRVYNWIAKRLDADDFAAKEAEERIGDALAQALRPPPPIPLPRGHQLRFTYCRDRGITVEPGKYAAVPLAFVLDNDKGQTYAPLLPTKLAQPPPLASLIGIEFDVNALNGVLQHLWRSGFLQEELEALDAEALFNEQDQVQELLSLRIADIAIRVPPTVRHIDDGKFELAAEASVTLVDGDLRTPARAYSAVGFRLTGGSAASGKQDVGAELELEDLIVSCEPRKDLLRPCYSVITEQLRANADMVHGMLTRIFTRRFREIAIGETIGVDDISTSFTTERATLVGYDGRVRVDISGRIHDDGSRK